MLRAVHQIVDASPKVLKDPVILPLLGQETVDRIHENLEKAQQPWALGLRSHVVLRSRFAEDRLEMAVQRGTTQYVLVGAGLETFAYRQPEWAKGLRIFEVDHPASQSYKRDLLGAAKIEVPANVFFASADLETFALRDALLQSGFDPRQPTFFACLGVMVYLSEPAADDIFHFVGSLPHGSEIVFTFSLPEDELTADEAKHRMKILAAVESMGEPWRTFYDPDILLKKLTAMGFSEMAFLSSEEAEEKYLKGRTDGLRAPRRGRIATATK
jgi:methyltransferase (TIGR00027 family)